MMERCTVAPPCLPARKKVRGASRHVSMLEVGQGCDALMTCVCAGMISDDFFFFLLCFSTV